MTTDSPEREARPLCNCAPCQREAAARNAPIPYLRRQVAELVFDALDESQRGRGVLPIHTNSDVDAAAAAVVALVQPELERLTFERDAANATADTLSRQLTDLRDDVLGDESIQIAEVVSAAGRELERLTAEVALHRERDALTRNALQADEEGPLQFLALRVRQQRDKAVLEASQLRADIGIRQGALNDVLEHDRSHDSPTDYYRAVEDVAELRREVSRLRDQLATAVVLPQDAAEQIANALGQYVEMENGGDEPEAQAVLALLRSWGVSSSEVEAPRPQQMARHKVSVRPHGGGWWAAECPECGVTHYDREQRTAEDWKDQHEADTLRPQLQDLEQVGASLELEDEGRPSGSERLEPRSEVDYVIRLKTECCASEGMTGIDCRLPKGHADWHSGRHDPRTDGTESVGYPVCIQWPRNEWDRCEPEQVAAQAARSEATPHLRVDGDTVTRYVCSEHIWGEVPCPNCEPREVPSPSLRKEGEDRG